MANFVSKALILKYLDNRCTPLEKEQVEQWLQLPGNEQVLDEILTEKLPDDILAGAAVDVAVEKMETWRTTLQQRMLPPVPKGGRIKKMFFRQVAIWATVLFGIGYYAVQQMGRQRSGIATEALMVKRNAMGQRASITLTDGSVIMLGANSQLTYPETFNGNTREVTLDGEAFFEISEDPLHPFIVHTGDVQTKVLGTSFRISAFSGAPLTVAVATGKVRVDQQRNGGWMELAVLTPGRQVTWNGNANSPVVAAVNAADITGWKTGRLVFNNKTLQEVTTELERWYNAAIVFRQPEKAQERITVTLFSGASLEKTLQTLAVGSNFKYTINGKQVIIQ